MYLINGKIEAKLPIRDRGLAYGDGLFETIAVVDNKAHNWDLHFDRLCEAAKRLKIQMPLESTLLRGLKTVSKSTKSTQFILKIILTRGEGGKGYQCPQNHPSHWIMIINPWPKYPDSYYLQGIDVQHLDIKLSMQPLLAGMKHLNRLEQVIAKQRLSDEYQEALLTNTNDFLIEGISSNFYFVEKGILCLPRLDQSGVNGTLRWQLIQLCEKLKIKLQIADFKIENIYHCDEAFYSNSIIGLWPVKSMTFLNAATKPCHPGPIYKKLAKIINKQLGHPIKK